VPRSVGTRAPLAAWDCVAVALFGTVRTSPLMSELVAGNQVLAAGSAGGNALVRPLLSIFFVSFSIWCCPFPIRRCW
jgi:hypothetical protein